MKQIVALITFILFLILAWYSWNWYKTVVVCCPETKEEVMVEYGPLIFDCASDDPITNDLWPEKRNEIISGKATGKKLLIAGPYFGNETEESGVARASKIKALFLPELNDEDIIVDARYGGNCEDAKMNSMHESRFKWVVRNDDIIEHLDHTVVNYRFDSTEEITSENTIAFISQLVEVLKSTKDKVKLTGHTSAEGTDEYNLQLGLDRANAFKDHLIRLGVDADQIQVESKGKSMPVADNSTEEGRKKNRRIEVHIIN
jgi:outer membrane protein OmpA-like peptidoglycan-associated protein